MPTRILSVGTDEVPIEQEKGRTKIVIQNLHATQYVYVADEPNTVANQGLRITPSGSLTLSYNDGDETEKTWYIVANGATTPVRIFAQFGRKIAKGVQ
jgi:hypothetical protein